MIEERSSSYHDNWLSLYTGLHTLASKCFAFVES